jgi:hypothetical protein
VITHHRARTAGSPPTSMPPAINGIFQNDTRLGRLELHSAGESTLVDELRARESGVTSRTAKYDLAQGQKGAGAERPSRLIVIDQYGSNEARPA